MAKIIQIFKKTTVKTKKILGTEIKSPIRRKYQVPVIVGTLLILGIATVSAINHFDNEMQSLHDSVSKSDNEELVELLNNRTKNLSNMTDRKGQTISIQETELDQLTQHLEALEEENSRLSTELHKIQGSEPQSSDSDNNKDEDRNWWDRFRDND